MKDVNISKPNIDITFYELLEMLWKGKVILICSVVFFLFLAFGYIKYSPQLWTSNAVITKPSYKEIMPLKMEVSTLYNVITNNVMTNNDEIDELNQLLSRDNVFKIYINSFASFDNKKQFIKNTLEFKKLNKENINRSVYINKLANKINIKPIIENGEKTEKIILEFQAGTAEKSNQYLVEYIKFINNIVRNNVKNDLLSFVNRNKGLLESKISSLNDQTAIKKQVLEKKNHYALEIAQKSQIEKPLENMGNKQLFPIDLGAKALYEQGKILEKIKDYSIFDSKISLYEAKLKSINTMKINNTGKVEFFTYLKSPEIPIKKDKPRNVFTLMLGTLIGFVIGLLLVMIKNRTSFIQILKEL